MRFGVGFHLSRVKYHAYFEAKKNSTDVSVSNSSLNSTETVDPNSPEDPALTVGNFILRIILLCVAIIFVAIPDGLLLAITLSLAFAIAKMIK